MNIIRHIALDSHKECVLADHHVVEQIRHLPKIELHRHLEGSVRLATLVDIGHEYGLLPLEDGPEALRPFVQMIPQEARNSQHFLGKFQTLRQFYLSTDIIRRVTREAVEDAAADNIQYLELRFTPRALSNILGCSYYDVIEWVCTSANQAAEQNRIQVRLIISMNRHESVEIGEHVLAAALDYRDQGVVALDLAGNEKDFPAQPFWELFQRAKELGLGITIHAGEWGGPANVREAIEHLHADRIGHGVRSVEDPALVEWLINRKTVLELCPTSNVHSGVVADWAQHPLQSLFRQGAMTTLNTDDPLVSNITLSDEMTYAVNEMNLTLDDLKQQTLNAARVAFLPPDERAALVAKYEAAFGLRV